METELKHYGVLGMKWGIRKDPDRAYEKASQKLRKLDTKLIFKKTKADLDYEKSTKAFARATNRKRMKKANKLTMKSNKSALKSEKARKKAIDWYKKMEKTFEGIELKNVSEEDVKLGKSYVQMIFQDNRTGRRK